MLTVAACEICQKEKKGLDEYLRDSTAIDTYKRRIIYSPYAADEVSRICRLMCGRASPHREAYASSARLRLAPRGVAANYFYQAEPERHSLSAHRAAKPLHCVR